MLTVPAALCYGVTFSPGQKQLSISSELEDPRRSFEKTFLQRPNYVYRVNADLDDDLQSTAGHAGIWASSSERDPCPGTHLLTPSRITSLVGSPIDNHNIIHLSSRVLIHS